MNDGVSDGQSWAPRKEVFIRRAAATAAVTFGFLLVMGLTLAFFADLPLLWVIPPPCCSRRASSLTMPCVGVLQNMTAGRSKKVTSFTTALTARRGCPWRKLTVFLPALAAAWWFSCARASASQCDICPTPKKRPKRSTRPAPPELAPWFGLHFQARQPRPNHKGPP